MIKTRLYEILESCKVLKLKKKVKCHRANNTRQAATTHFYFYLIEKRGLYTDSKNKNDFFFHFHFTILFIFSLCIATHANKTHHKKKRKDRRKIKKKKKKIGYGM